MPVADLTALLLYLALIDSFAMHWTLFTFLILPFQATYAVHLPAQIQKRDPQPSYSADHAEYTTILKLKQFRELKCDEVPAHRLWDEHWLHVDDSASLSTQLGTLRIYKFCCVPTGHLLPLPPFRCYQCMYLSL